MKISISMDCLILVKFLTFVNKSSYFTFHLNIWWLMSREFTCVHTRENVINTYQIMEVICILQRYVCLMKHRDFVGFIIMIVYICYSSKFKKIFLIYFNSKYRYQLSLNFELLHLSLFHVVTNILSFFLYTYLICRSTYNR